MSDQLFEILDERNFIYETLLNYDGTVQLKLYKDDIEKFTEIPFSVIKEIQKHYVILSLSPQLTYIEEETFGCLVLKMRSID